MNKHFYFGSSLFAAIVTLSVLIGCNQSAKTAAEPKILKVLLDERASFNEKSYFTMAQISSDPKWKKRWWIEKTTRLMRGGQGLRPTEPIDEIAKKSEDEWIDQLMADERFADSMLDFNMYFLGFKEDSVRENNGYNLSVFEYPSAIASARTVAFGGDYFLLFDLFSPTYYMGPLYQLEAGKDEDKNLSVEELRLSRIGKLQADLLAMIKEIKTSPNVTTQQICTKLQFGNIFFTLGIPITLTIQGLVLNPRSYNQTNAACFGTTNPLTPKNFIPILETIYQNNKIFFAEMLKYEPRIYNPEKISQIKTLDLKASGLDSPWMNFSFRQIQSFPNSSTNYNRKRASYILKQFFCDDLTPVAIENPTSHTSGPHGSETSCYACHYKLDPMAGFFRNRGVFFVNFEDSSRILFDDGVLEDKDKYVETWKSTSAKRKLDIGYIRSVRSEADNEYGESLEDLSQILRNAPEVKACMVKRLFEYFVAPDQMVDAGYLSQLSNQLITDSKTDSTLAVKNTVRQLLKSQSFKEHDMDPTQCYDRTSSGSSSHSPPCRVAFLLQKNCVQCHGSVQASGRLDLTQWIKMPDGSFNFPHLGTDGKQKSKKETITEFIARINSSDPEERMPYKKLMTSQDRQELFLWAEELLK